MSGYWYATRLKDGGNVLVYGPFTNEQCKVERRNWKLSEREYNISPPFVASSKDEALERAPFWLT